jgi:hypothetical protein
MTSQWNGCRQSAGGGFSIGDRYLCHLHPKVLLLLVLASCVESVLEVKSRFSMIPFAVAESFLS